MKDSINNRKKKLLALCLSVMMFSSVGAIAACKDSNSTDSSSSSSSSTTNEEKDTGLITNAGFETFKEDNAINTSVTGWTRSTSSATSGSGLSSKAASGIIDLETEAWKNLTGSKHVATSAADAKAHWDEMTVKDKLTFYEKWESENKDKKIEKELDFYKALNIDLGDIPDIAHFDTHDKAVENGGEDTKILMIHNQNPEPTAENNKTIGTGQKFTSSSTVTVKAGTSAKFSVWVRTQDLKSSATDGSSQDAVGKGAYISVTHSVGGKSLEDYKVENIQTDEWVQYSFILKGSSYTDTTFSLVLGLGQGGGTYRGEYVNGYAFFDDIECEVISNDDFDTALSAGVDHSVGFATQGEDKVVDVSKAGNEDKTSFALNFYGDANKVSEISNDVFSATTVSATTSEINGTFVSSDKNNNLAPWLGEGKDSTGDITGIFASGVTENVNATLYNKYFKEDTAFAGENTLLMMSNDGVAYTAKSTYEFGFTQSDYLAVSFFVKTSDMKSYTGAGATLVDGNNKTSFASIDTSTLEPVEVNDEKLYGDWQQYFFFVENSSEDSTTTFNLEFTFGPTSIGVDSTLDNFHSGFAAFTGVKLYELSKEEYESAQGGTFAKIVSVVGDKEDSAANTGTAFDTAKGTPSDAIKEGLANAQNYKGVYMDSSYITGTGTNTAINSYANAGLISKEYFTSADEGYFATASGAWFDGIKAAATSSTADKVWNEVFGNDATQPLFLWNDGSSAQLAKAYGYIGKSTSIAANTYTAVSVRVKGTGANAYVRLVDTNDENAVLSIAGKLTYWYDDDGNICTGDPAEKATQVAFKLQPNGLYKANKNWSGYADLTDKDAWFANLNAYANADGSLPASDLLVADGGASHDYNDYWNNEGMDGIAYYYKDGVYYADKAMKIAVSNVADIAALTPRTTATESKTLEAQVAPSKDAWTTVTFYVHTGDVAKNYRLELWSGAKDGTANAANTYVIFDYNNPGTAESNFTGLIAEYEEKVADTDKFEGVFSYFDTASYLRYNKDLDENKIGNLYETNYTPSANSEGIAYLKYAEGNEYTVFADYQYSEKTVAAAEADDGKDEDSSSDDTTDSDMNVFALASSLIVAIVLVAVIGIICTRKIIKASRKKKAHKSK